MSYCRFSDGDVYLIASIWGGFECCSCKLGKKIPSVFTCGKDGLDPDDPRIEFLKLEGPCTHCDGEGCDECMILEGSSLLSRSECIEHIEHHIEVGHKVPDGALARLKKELEEKGEYNFAMDNPNPIIQI